MIGKNQRADSQPSPSSLTKPELTPKFSLQEPLVPLNPATSPDSMPSNQKIEIVFAQGHRLCLQGSFDWEELRSWLVPLLTLGK